MPMEKQLSLAEGGNWQYMLGCGAIGFVGFHVLAFYVFPWILALVVFDKQQKKENGCAVSFSRAMKQDWAGRCVSMLHGLLMTQAGTRALLDPQLHSDFLHGYTPIMAPYFWMSLGYELYDCYYMAYINGLYRMERQQQQPQQQQQQPQQQWKKDDKSHRANSDWLMYAHHAFVIGGILLYRYFQVGLLALTVFAMMEAISPFIHIRWMLLKFNHGEKWYFLLNGLMLFVVYVVFRILIFPYLFYAYAKEKNISVLDVPGQIPYVCSIGTALIVLANLHWFRLLVQAILRKFCREKKNNNKKDT